MYSREIKVKGHHSVKGYHSDKENIIRTCQITLPVTRLHLQTARLRLRPFREADFEIAETYYRDPEFLNAMEGEPPADPPTADSLTRVGRIMAEQGFLFAIVEGASGRAIGEVCLQWMNLDRAKILGEKVMRMPIGIWDKSLWGRGYGREVVWCLMEYAFEVLEIDRLRPVDVSADNARSVALWRACGLRIAGESSDRKIDFEITRSEYVRQRPFHPEKNP